MPFMSVDERGQGWIPVSSYRLQLHRGFTFSDASDVVPYLSALGVTDCYISPPFTARPGSTHGYDICNHNEINPELGGEAEFRRFAACLTERAMGLTVDIVPNHMSNDPETNAWWRDVLENGPSSPFAHYFDIDWDPLTPELEDRLLLPILGEQYGEALERGKLRLEFRDDALVLHCGEYRLPINPRRAPIVYESQIDTLKASLGEDHPQLREFLSILTSLRNLPPYTERDATRIAERTREKEVARERLARLVLESEPIRRYIEAAVSAFNGTPGEPGSFDRLHGLLELQAYRLASWRTASDEINYRRFFDVNDLAGLRVEDPDVFDGIHRLILRLIAEGTVTGIRVDHIDGLADPAAYLRRLRDTTRQARLTQGEGGQPDAPVYVVVEKILSSGETLPAEWATDGTTGYGFLNEVNGIFINGRHARSLTRTCMRLTGRDTSLTDVEYESKRLIIGTSMSSEFQVLNAALNRLAKSDRRVRDFTFGSIRRALREVIACFPVYRTYVTGGGTSPSDRTVVDAAILVARLRNPAMDPSIFEFLREVLLPDRSSAGEAEGGLPYDQRLPVAMKVQQYTAPVQAKGIEDTAFYRYNVLLSLTEVGGTPRQFGRTVESFHRANAHRLIQWPLEMNATATHDTKRGEDARARVNVLSEIPSEWREAVSRWMRLNKNLRTTVDGAPAPDRGDEYHFYQALLATWPPAPEDAPSPDRAPDDLVGRLVGYMSKAIRESKLHTSWISPNDAYESAVTRFVERALAGDGAGRFVPALVPFARRVAKLGMVNSLAQLTLKLVSPGVPDFYQGTELWDLSLVDPDNRRPVDYAHRRALLDGLEPLLSKTGVFSTGPDDPPAGLAALLEDWHDGRIKLFVTASGLRLRRARPDLFHRGSYVPIAVDGTGEDHVVACARQWGSDVLLAVVPRLTTSGQFPGNATGEYLWRDTRLLLPDQWRNRAFRSVLTGAPVKPIRTAHGTWITMSQVLAAFPVALLWALPD